VSSTQLGKSKAFSQNCMILLIILAQPYPWLELPAVVFIWIAVIATVTSGLDYLWRYRRFIS
jgi:phosphatidylglycerophosphate synthase